jgi:quercetin dioxygenase-like cupin family protein
VWGRPYIQKLRTGDVPQEDARIVAPTLSPGTEVRILSRDAAANASTCLWRLPPGWSHREAFMLAGDEQLFVLEGDLAIGTNRLTAGYYMCHPAGSRHEPLHSEDGALVLAMWDGWTKVRTPDSPNTPSISMVDTTGVSGRPTPIDGPVPGILVKILRTVNVTGGMTMLITIPPGWHEPRSEHHDCIEESYKLDGNIWIVENGDEQVLSAGDYFFRPPRIKHGPMRTEGGTTSLIRFSSTVVNHYGPL